MPERRIDAIGKADAASWSSLQLSKGSPNLLRVISGQLSHMPAGEVISAVVQKAAKGAFTITLNGETFIIKGLPSSLVGKAVSFVVRQMPPAGQGGFEMFWLGPSRSTGSTMQKTVGRSAADSSSVQARHRAAILSGMSAELMKQGKSGNMINGRVDAIEAGKMTLALTLAGAKASDGAVVHHIQTSLVQGLQSGQRFSARIQFDMNNKAMLEILPQAAGLKGTGAASERLETASFALKAGDIVGGLVQKRLPNGHIQLNIQGMSVEAPAPKSIDQGDLLLLRMNKPPADFQLISAHKNAAGKAMAVVKNNLAMSREPLASNMTAIGNILPALAAAGLSDIDGLAQLDRWFAASAGAQQSVSGEVLSRNIRDSGAGLEAKLLGLSQQLAAGAPQSAALLQDLKAIMLQLSQAQTGNINQAGLIKMLTELSQHSAARIETNQALNVLAQVQGDPIRFELPMLVGQQLVNVHMSVQQQGGQSSEHTDDGYSGAEQSYHVLFALELSGLGNMRVDASISDSAVQARIYSDQDDAGQFVRSHMQRLETRLQEIGYKEVYVLASPSAPDAEKQRRFDQLTHMAPASLNLLDVIA